MRARAEVKRFDNEVKRLAGLVAQRKRRADAKLLEQAVAHFPPGAVLDVVRYADGSTGVEARPLPVPPRVPTPAPVPRVRRVAAELAEAVAPVEAEWAAAEKRSKRAKKAKSSAEHLLDTLEVTPPHLEGLEKAKKMRSRCREAGFLLQARGVNFQQLYKAGAKIVNCAVWGLYQSLSPEVNYKVGTALCKCRLCPNCQRVLSAKRRANFLAWWDLNRDALRPYFFYHMVLTVRHSAAANLRTGLYTSELLAAFAKLRGTDKSLSGAEQRHRSARWKHFVAGGSYSVEIKPSEDGTQHIHIHVLVIAYKQLTKWNDKSAFLLHVEPLWRQITGNDAEGYAGISLDKVYYRDENGKRVNAHKGSQVDAGAAIAEAEKYTLKADAADLADYSDEFLAALLSMKNRYYGRFGCLHPKDALSAQFAQLGMLCTDYQDLEAVTALELARLVNPETGEVVDADATEFVATPNRNMIPMPAHVAPEPAQVVVKMMPTGVLHPQDGTALAGRPILAPVVVQHIPAPPDERLHVAGLHYRALALPSYLARAQYRFFPYQEKQRAAIYLGKSIAGEYDPALELDAPGVLES